MTCPSDGALEDYVSLLGLPQICGRSMTRHRRRYRARRTFSPVLDRIEALNDLTVVRLPEHQVIWRWSEAGHNNAPLRFVVIYYKPAVVEVYAEFEIAEDRLRLVDERCLPSRPPEELRAWSAGEQSGRLSRLVEQGATYYRAASDT